MQVTIPTAFKRLNIDAETSRLVKTTGAHLIFCVADRAHEYWLSCDVTAAQVDIFLSRSIRDVLDYILALRTPSVVLTRSPYLLTLARVDIDEAPEHMKNLLRRLEKVSVEELVFRPIIVSFKDIADAMLQSGIKRIVFSF